MRTSPTTIDPVWIRDLNLADSDRKLVCSGELNYKVVDAINTLIGYVVADYLACSKRLRI